jgi:hypothetical protein
MIVYWNLVPIFSSSAGGILEKALRT